MKLTKRMKNAVIQTTLIHSFIFLALFFILLFSIYPRTKIAFDQRKLLQDTYTERLNVEKQGVSLWDVRSVAAEQGLIKNSYIQTLLKNTSPLFYTTYFENTGTGSYSDFLSAVEQDIASEKSSASFQQKQQDLAEILPVYTPNAWNEELLNNFSFTNYVEKVLYTFNLTAKWDIGTGNIEKIQDQTLRDEPSSFFEENVYVIPIDLEIVGQKKDILDFLHFFENVGKVRISDNEFAVYRDNFIQKPLTGDPYSQSYNIYKHQVAEILSVSFQKYPDSSPSVSTWNGGLISRIQQDQARERAEVQVRIWFYVAGIPRYQMQEFILSLQSEYATINGQIAKDIQTYTKKIAQSKNGSSLQALQDMQSLQYLLVNFQDDIEKIQKDLKQGKDIEQVYNETTVKMKQLKKIQEQYNANMQILTLEN